METVVEFKFYRRTGTRKDATGRLPERSEKTLRQHETNATRLLLEACVDPQSAEQHQLADLVSWFTIAHGVWAVRTIRTYRSALHCALEHAEERSVLSAAVADGLFEKLGQKVQARSARSTPRTSAKKAKYITAAEHKALMVHFVAKRDVTSRLVAMLLALGVDLGLRPVEYHSAVIAGRSLRVLCAKNSNGRAIGEIRTLDLSGWSDRKLRALAEFLKTMRDEVARCGGWPRLYRRLAKALERACVALKLRKICFYSLRHQMISSAKQANLPIEEIAAIVGHKSTKSTGAYGKACRGWLQRPTVRSTFEQVSLVTIRAITPPRPNAGLRLGP